MGISDALVDLGMLPVQDISQLPKSSWEALSLAGLILTACKKCWPSALVCGTEVGPIAAPLALGRPPSHLSIFFFLLPLGMILIYILTYIYIFIYKDIGKLCAITPLSPVSLTTMSRALELRFDT
jgi:hypothetical protein